MKSGSGAGERFINFTIEYALGTPWAHTGTEIANFQFALPAKPLPKAKVIKVKNDQVSADGLIKIPNAIVAPQLTLWRAPTDNDLIGHISEKWDKWGLRQLTRVNTQVKRGATKTKIVNTWKTNSGIKIKHEQIVETVVDGIRVTETVVLTKILDDIARVGTNFELPGELNQYTYFGTGPFETMPDRAIGKIHRWSSTVAEQFVPYVKPQENGGHMGVRWFTLSNQTNHGIYLQLDKPRMVTVTPFRSTELADATHDVFLKPSGNTIVTIDAIQRGVGTASCGPDTLPKYKIKPGTYKWSWTLINF